MDKLKLPGQKKGRIAPPFDMYFRTDYSALSADS